MSSLNWDSSDFDPLPEPIECHAPEVDLTPATKTLRERLIELGAVS